ncbi:MAG: cyclic pyranopterin monophosphate synthase MoaC [Chloroflexi bacterium]|nr:cyclic pyranopterin monophosphate synthase MoaC [Chloroflexota bacterium]
MSELTHLDDEGTAKMVDVGDKADTERMAVAEGRVYMNEMAFKAVQDGTVKKGDVLTVARIAGIMAAKKTSDLIPLCHPLPLSHIDIQLTLEADKQAVHIVATTRTTGKTGVEMEALTAVSVTALTVYDMAKALDRTMRIDGIRLLEKQGGKSGHFKATS